MEFINELFDKITNMKSENFLDLPERFKKFRRLKQNFLQKINEKACKQNFEQKINKKEIKKVQYCYWPLCLDDNRTDSLEIDTCSTSYCVSILATNNVDNKFDSAIKGGLCTLLKMRQANGEFPPVIEPNKLQDENFTYNGGIAISDNYFALTALLDSGFLNENFRYKDILPDELHELSKRVVYIYSTIEYFKAHMVSQLHNDGELCGWYYNNTERDKNPAFLTTINVFSVLIRVKSILEQLGKYEAYVNEINTLIQKVTDFLCYNNKIFEDDRFGLGRDVNSNNVSLIHTCKMVDAFVLNSSTYLDEQIISALESTILPLCDKSFFADTYKYSERYQIINEAKRQQNILHESYPESVLLLTLIGLLKYSSSNSSSVLQRLKDTVREKLDEILQAIKMVTDSLKGQRTRKNEFGGFFKSHIRRNDGDCPIFASAESYKAIDAWEDLLEGLSDINETNATNIAINKVEKWISKNSSSERPIAVPQKILDEIIDEYNKIPTISPEQKQRLDNSKTFLRLLRDQQIRIDANKIDDFKDFINNLVEGISTGNLGNYNDQDIA